MIEKEEPGSQREKESETETEAETEGALVRAKEREP